MAGLSRRYRQRAADCGPHRGGRPRVHGGQPGPADHPAPAQQAALLQNIIGDRNTRVAGRKSSSWYRFIYSTAVSTNSRSRFYLCPTSLTVLNCRFCSVEYSGLVESDIWAVVFYLLLLHAVQT